MPTELVTSNPGTATERLRLLAETEARVNRKPRFGLLTQLTIVSLLVSFATATIVGWLVEWHLSELVTAESASKITEISSMVWAYVTSGFLMVTVAGIVLVLRTAKLIQRASVEREQLISAAAEARAETAAARELEQVKDELTSVVSHELRTPLASIMGFIELLLYREFSPVQQRQFLQLVHAEGLRLTTLINDFLDLQRLESHRAAINRRPVDLCALILQTVSSAGEDSERPITVSIEDSLPMVIADADRVQQVLANLLSNARKYSPQGGAIHVHAQEDAGGLVVTVRDQGLGIPEGAVPKLFRKFYRVDNTDHREIKGTGLGLMICRKIMEAHGGSIWAESAGLGHGSSFHFKLPLHSTGGAATPVTVDVLIVEDDPSFARLLEAQLSERQLSALTVGSAEAAQNHLSVRTPRAIVLDLLLPGMQGDAFLRELSRSLDPPPPCFVVSMKDCSPSEISELTAHGAVAVIRKGPRVAIEVSSSIAAILEPQPTLA